MTTTEGSGDDAPVRASSSLISITVLVAACHDRPPRAPQSTTLGARAEPSAQPGAVRAAPSEPAPPPPDFAVDAPRLSLDGDTATLDGRRTGREIELLTELRERRAKWRAAAAPQQPFHGQVVVTVDARAPTSALVQVCGVAARAGYATCVVLRRGRGAALGAWAPTRVAARSDVDPLGPGAEASQRAPEDGHLVLRLGTRASAIESRLAGGPPFIEAAPGVGEADEPSAHRALAAQVLRAWRARGTPPPSSGVIVKLEPSSDVGPAVAALLEVVAQLPPVTRVDLSPDGHRAEP